MHFNAGLYRLLACLCAAGAVAAAIAFISLWVPIPYLLRNILYIYLAFSAAGAFIFLFSFPGMEKLIETADSLGLRERIATAWQLRGEHTVIAGLQRQDAYHSVTKADFRKLYPIRFPARPAVILTAALAITGGLLMVPTYAKENALQKEKLKDAVDQQLEEIEKVSEKLENSGDLKEDEKNKIRDEIERLAEELKQADSEEEAMKALSRTENELEKLDVEKQLEKLGETFARNDMTSGLGEAVRDGSATDIKQALEQLMGQIEEKKISPEELAEMFRQASEEAGNDELKKELQQTADELSSGDSEARQEAFDDLGGMLSERTAAQAETGTAQALGQLSEMMRQAKKSISGVDNSLPSGTNASGGASGNAAEAGAGGSAAPGRNAAQGKGQGAGQGAGGVGQTPKAGGTEGGAGSGAGQPAGQGQAQGAGQGSGSGGQGGGSGAGEGSADKDAGYTGSEGAGGGREAGEGQEEAYEQLYDPDYLGGDADPDYVTGQKQDGGISNYSQKDQSPVMKGAMRPYGKVLDRYGGEASSYMEKADIPAAMREIVREYFESLE